MIWFFLFYYIARGISIVKYVGFLFWTISSSKKRIQSGLYDIDLIGLAEQVYFHLMAPKTMDCSSRWRNVYHVFSISFLKIVLMIIKNK